MILTDAANSPTWAKDTIRLSALADANLGVHPPGRMTCAEQPEFLMDPPSPKGTPVCRGARNPLSVLLSGLRPADEVSALPGGCRPPQGGTHHLLQAPFFPRGAAIGPRIRALKRLTRQLAPLQIPTSPRSSTERGGTSFFKVNTNRYHFVGFITSFEV